MTERHQAHQAQLAELRAELQQARDQRAADRRMVYTALLGAAAVIVDRVARAIT